MELEYHIKVEKERGRAGYSFDDIMARIKETIKEVEKEHPNAKISIEIPL